VTRRAIVIALIASLVIMVFLWKNIQKQQQIGNVGPVVERPKPQTKSVVIAKRSFPAKTRMDDAVLKNPECFEVREIDATIAPPDFIPSLASLTNKFSGVPIMPGDIMTQSRFIEKDALISFSRAIPEGKRAITIQVSNVTGVAGFIQQGDYVDIIANFPGKPDQLTGERNEAITKIVLQDIMVLAVNKVYESVPNIPTITPAINATSKLDLVTLAVSPEELERITYIDYNSIPFKLVLKRPADIGKNTQTRGVTQKIVLKSLGVQPEPVTTTNAEASTAKTPTPVPVNTSILQTDELGKVEIFYGKRKEEMYKYGTPAGQQTSYSPPSIGSLQPNGESQTSAPQGE